MTIAQPRPSTRTVTGPGINIGVLLNNANLTWGWFQGGFAPTTPYNAPSVTTAVCGSTSTGHSPFRHHRLRFSPQSLRLFFADGKPAPPAAHRPHRQNGSSQPPIRSEPVPRRRSRTATLPAVSFVKAKAFQNGHPGNSDPLDEQTWLVTAVNAIENSPYWDDTAIIITYDDSDGWYDHQMDTVVNQSSASDDELAGPGSCGTTPDGGNPGRCGYGPRLPLIVISRYAKGNYIDHRHDGPVFRIRFIEDNWEPGTHRWRFERC